MRNKISPHYTAPCISRLATAGQSCSWRVLSRMPTAQTTVEIESQSRVWRVGRGEGVAVRCARRVRIS